MPADFDLRERRELSDLLDELGPDKPTLCEGWTTAHMAAHIVVRERDVRSGPGIIFGGKLGEYTEKLMAGEMKKGYPAVVERVRTGPPFGPMKIPVIRSNVNFVEFVTHHEDVRRANGLGPRTDRPDLDDAVWGALRKMARFQFRKVKPFGVTLVRSGPAGPDDTIAGEPQRVEVKGSPTVVLTGGPVDLLLYANGRKDAAVVRVEGPDDAVAALRAASLGI